MNLNAALAMIRAQFPDIPYDMELKPEDNCMAPSIETQVMNTIRNSQAPLLSYRDFTKRMPSVDYNDLRSAIKALRESGKIETSTTGYRIVSKETLKPGENKPKLRPDATIKERQSAPKKIGVPCLCGCGETTKPGSFFIPGHDARTKGYVVKVNKGKMDASCLRTALDYGAVIVHKGVYSLLSVADIRKLSK